MDCHLHGPSPLWTVTSVAGVRMSGRRRPLKWEVEAEASRSAGPVLITWRVARAWVEMVGL